VKHLLIQKLWCNLPSMSKDLPYFISLAAVPGIGPSRFKILLKHFKTAESFWTAPEKTLEKILTPNLFQQFLGFKKSFDIDEYIKRISDLGVKVITIEDRQYPKLLKEIADPPPVLYVKGEIP